MTNPYSPVPLHREPGAAVPPVRIVHLGLGAFHRSHQAWYTAHATDAAEWGIAAFTGRSTEIAAQLTDQDGQYTLVVRGPEGDSFEVVDSVVRAIPGTDVAAFVELAASEPVAILTLTITEGGYRLGADGRLDLTDPDVAADVALLRRLFDAQAALPGVEYPRTAFGRVLLALEQRRRISTPALAIVPCDNIPDNGHVVREALGALATATSSTLAAWLDSGISVVSTSVDRITPRGTPEDAQLVLDATGVADRAPVVTEPFSDWVLAGDFPSGRPAWETAGARFVDDIAPWGARKLWMLNGAHTLLAASGPLRGHALVSEAIDDPVCRDLVTALWEEDARHLTGVEVDDYAADLLARFRNPRIEHRLAQIALDATTKMRVRIVPVARLERAAGRSAAGCAAAVAAWILAGHDAVETPGAAAESRTARQVADLDPVLGGDAAFCARVDAAVADLTTKALLTESETA
ncbi:mannitol dehydrogenase family protein [Agromyces sp. SYSU T0242]|uniref:mannitol dehydrogenase family protein n=1 Tax=Agromyces litoreus TaxID=3158561 RepID=UPI00339244F9